MDALVGRRGIVTGASRGIGLAVATLLANEGANLLLTSSGAGPDGPGTAPEALIAAADMINDRGRGRAAWRCGPVEDFDFAGELVQGCVDEFGGIDLLVNVAGIPTMAGASSIAEVRRLDFDRLIDVNLTGTFNTCRQVAPLMADGGGAIVNTSSDSFTGRFLSPGYASAKGGVNSLTYLIAGELRQNGVRCNAICPSALTAMAQPEHVVARMTELVRLGLVGEERIEAARDLPGPEFVAPLYAYLASDMARDITGEVFRIEGGAIGRYPAPIFDTIASRPVAAGPWTLPELDALKLHE